MAYQVIDGVLDLSTKKLKEIPEEVFDLVEITTLDLSFNQLTSLPPDIGKLVNLEKLVVSFNQLTSLPSEIGKLVNLKKLIVSANRLTSLPSAICDGLVELYVASNELISLPSEIGRLFNLKKLVVSHNQLTSLPLEIWKLVNLEQLLVSVNQLTSLPPDIGKLVNLKELWVSRNQLTSLPLEIEKLVNLKELSVSENRLTSLPSGYDDGQLSHHRWPYNEYGISQTEFDGVGGIGKLVNLEQLDVSGNQLTSLPSDIWELVNLKELDVSHNQLTFLPLAICDSQTEFDGVGGIGKLVKLKELSVSDNQLTSLPPDIGLLRNLIYLGYSNNPIEYIPPQVQRLQNRLRNNCQKVYQDKQSVHNSGIQKSFKETVLRLSNKKPKLNIHQTVEEVLESSLLDDSKKSIVEYCSSEDVHSELNMTYSELLVLVWDRIRKNKDMKEILKVLDTELTDSECKCFTGRITRLVNCLNGFDTDVIINISDNEQLSNLMVLINNKYTVKEDKVKALTEAMKERGFSQEKIDEWVEYVE